MIDLFSFSFGSLSLHEGNSTLKLYDDIGFPDPGPTFMANIEVLHEKCGKSGKQITPNIK